MWMLLCLVSREWYISLQGLGVLSIPSTEQRNQVLRIHRDGRGQAGSSLIKDPVKLQNSQKRRE